MRVLTLQSTPSELSFSTRSRPCPFVQKENKTCWRKGSEDSILPPFPFDALVSPFLFLQHGQKDKRFSIGRSIKGLRNKRVLVNAGYRVLLPLFPPFESRFNALAEREKFSAGKGVTRRVKFVGQNANPCRRPVLCDCHHLWIFLSRISARIHV